MLQETNKERRYMNCSEQRFKAAQPKLSLPIKYNGICTLIINFLNKNFKDKTTLNIYIIEF